MFNFNLAQDLAPETTIEAPAKAKAMRELYDFLHGNMRYAQDQQEQYEECQGPTGTIRQRIAVSGLLLPQRRQGKALHTTHQESMTHPDTGSQESQPYPISEGNGSHGYRLQLPTSMKIHPVFHISLLEPAPNDTQPGQVTPPPPPIVVEGYEELKVEEVLDSRHYRRRPQ